MQRPASMDEKPSLLSAVPAPEAAASYELTKYVSPIWYLTSVHSYRPTNSDIRKLKKEVKEENARKRAAKEYDPVRKALINNSA